MYYNNAGQLDTQTAMNAYITRVFGMMFLGLLVTGGTAVFTVTNTFLLNLIFGNPFSWIILAVAEIAVVIALSSQLQTLSRGAATGLYYLYAVLNGLTLGSIFLVYDIGTIGLAFVTASLSFGVMAIYGLVTKADLTRIGSMLMMILFGCVIAILLNMVLGIFGIYSSRLDLILSFVLVAVFVGLVAYDTQKLKGYFIAAAGNGEMEHKLAVMGALALYLDFINIFLYLLRIFGRNRD